MDPADFCQPMQDLALPGTYGAVYLAGPTFNLLPDVMGGPPGARLYPDDYDAPPIL